MWWSYLKEIRDQIAALLNGVGTIPVSGTITATVDESTLAKAAQLPATIGAKAAASSLGVALSTEDAAKVPALDASGGVPMTLVTRLAGEDIANDVLKVEQRYSYFNQAGTTTGASVKGSAGFLHSLVINTPVVSTVITLYDGTSTGGTKIATITLPATLLNDGPITVLYDVAFSTGLFIVVATGASDVTMSFR